MFDKCIKCNRMGESCVPNLMLLPFSELIKWCDKRQKHLGWSNQTLAEKTKQVPVGTINRIKAGDYQDCKYSTMRYILIALIGGTSDEFSCTEMVEKELKQKEELEQQTVRIAAVEKENAVLRNKLDTIDELHRQDIRIIREEYLERIAFLKDQLKTWQSHYQKKERNE